MRASTALCAAACVHAMACLEIEEDVVSEGALGTTNQEIAAMRYWSVSSGSTGGNWADVDLGPDYDRTCFLQGITGQLLGDHYDPLGGSASVSVFQSNGRWRLMADGGTGANEITGYATCIAATSNRRSLYWFDDISDGHIERNPNTQCFLTEVSATVGFTSPNAFVHLYRDGNWWTLTGNLAGWGHAGSARAVCVDLTQTVNGFQLVSSN